MVRFIILFAFACQVASAQDQPPSALQPSPDNLFAESNSQTRTPASSPATEAQKANWKPKLAITLTTSPNGQNVVHTIVRTVPVYSTAYEEVETGTGNNIVIARIPVQKLESREVREQMMVPGAAVVLCDGLEIAVEATKTGPQYSFDSKGPMILQHQSSVIRAESGSYSNGELKLTKASVAQAGLTMKSESLTVKLKVYGITTAAQPNSASGTRTPLPTDTFDRRDVGAGQRRGNRRDDWNPQTDHRPDAWLQNAFQRKATPVQRPPEQDQRAAPELLDAVRGDRMPEDFRDQARSPQQDVLDEFVPEDSPRREDSLEQRR